MNNLNVEKLLKQIEDENIDPGYQIRCIGKILEEFYNKYEKKPILKFKKNNSKAILPKYQNKGDACFDFHALIENEAGYVILDPNSQVAIPTGLSAVIPEGYEIQVRPRSGMAFKHKITITNSPGTIDEHYRNFILVLLFNLGKESIIINNGDRIAQGKLSKVYEPEIIEIDDFSEEEKNNDRGGGFGSTGT